MSKLKYPRNEKGQSILGEEYGIQITKPWSDEMYKHNDMVSEKMKTAIFKALEELYHNEDYSDMTEVVKSITGYGFYVMDEDDIFQEGCNNLDRLQNNYLHEWTWPELLKKGYVEPIDCAFVGYNKK